jgi:hypothetical protein
MLTPPLAPHCPLFLLATPHLCYPLFYLFGEPAILLLARIPIHSCPWLAINCSPLATSPTLTHPMDQVTIFTQTTSTTSAVPSDTIPLKIIQYLLKMSLFVKRLYWPHVFNAFRTKGSGKL